MKTGRNDPCPCGSGKKHKHCCLAPAGDGTDLLWRRVRRALEGHGTRMLRFVGDTYGRGTFDEAWGEFVMDPQQRFDPDHPQIPVFMPWLFYRWAPAREVTSVSDPTLHDAVPATVFLARHGHRLDPLLRRYLESCCDEPFSFYEILRTDPGKGLRLRCLITSNEIEVQEHAGSETLQPGDMIYAHLARLDDEDIVLLDGCSPVAFPPAQKLELIKLREQIRSSRLGGKKFLRAAQVELRMFYLRLADSILNPAMPALQNTDGDPLELHRLVFAIDSPQVAFDALKHLSLAGTEEDLLAEASRDAEGALRQVHFSWHRPDSSTQRGWGNTVLGSIEISGRRLTAEVNSAARAARFREIVQRALGERAKLRATAIQTAKQALARENRAWDRGSSSEHHDRLAATPEVQAHLHRMMADHYEAWVEQPLPALDGRTPLEAARDPLGRELVEALVAGIERDECAPGVKLEPAVVSRMRQRLGLGDRGRARRRPRRHRTSRGEADMDP